jgi:membrane-associated phospholipid phosphatase
VELDFLLWLQSLATPWLDTVMGAITQLGSEYFYLVALCFLYWCVEVRGTMRLFVIFLLSVYIGGALKELVGRLRPFQEYPELIQARFTDTAPDLAFPSAHALHSTVFWGSLAMMMRRRWLYIVAPILVLLIGFSRLYLGLHWPTDVLGGLVLGLVILGFAYAILRLLDSNPVQVKFPAGLALAVVPLFFFVLFPAHSGAQNMGVLFGAIVGHLVERRYIRFPVRRVWWQQAVKLAIGLAGALGLMLGLSAVLAPWQTAIDAVRFTPAANPPLLWGLVGESLTLLRYALVGLWCTLAAPGIFRLLFGRDTEAGQVD